MKKRLQSFISIVLLLALTGALSGCGGRSAPQPAETPTAAPETGKDMVYENGGVKLIVPEDKADLVLVEIPESGEPLFSVTEKASLEAAEKLHPENTSGSGWLFSISRVSADRLHELMCFDMSGREVIARSGGEYYLLNHPTDVRIEREGTITTADSQQWTDLNEWVNGEMRTGFIEDNGLTACRYSNTGLDILLARIAWREGTAYQLGGLAHGLFRPADGAGDAFAAELLETAAFRYSLRTEAPDGEYFYIIDPEGGTRYEFFRGEGGRFVRESRDGYTCFYETENGADAAAVAERWYEALAAGGAPVYDAEKYMAAEQAVLREYAALDWDALDSFSEEDHPELPWYTAVIANPVRNTLFYAEHDFSGDGIPELVIAAGDESYRQPMAIYAFDGEKLVYLCRDQALGERSTVSYADGEFIVFASGGAAVGSILVYTIAPDGYSTRFRTWASYEYSSDGTVTLTVEQGELTEEEFEYYQQLRGEFPALEYVRFAPGT